MENFDVALFNKNQVDGHFDFITIEGMNVSQWVTAPRHYVERAKKPESPFETYKEFHFSNGSLKKSGELFYNFRIGSWREYDEKGSLISEFNEDIPFAFSISQLEIKMRELKVFILKESSDARINRLILDDKPVYVVTYPSNPIEMDNRIRLTIDGTTGKTIETKSFIQMRK